MQLFGRCFIEIFVYRRLFPLRHVLLNEIAFFTKLGVKHVLKLMAGRIDEIARSVDLVAILKDKTHVCFELFGVLLLALIKLCPYRTEIRGLLNDAVIRRLCSGSTQHTVWGIRVSYAQSHCSGNKIDVPVCVTHTE